MSNNSRAPSYIPEEHLKPFWFKPGKEHPYFGKKRPEHSATLKGRKRGHYRGVKVVIRECSFCKKEIECLNERIKNKNVFCNRECLFKFKVGKNASNYKGGKLTVKCYICKKKLEVEKWKIKKQKRFICSEICNKEFRKEIMRISQNEGKLDYDKKGSNNPNWRNGSSLEEYGFEFDSSLKEQVRLRDNYKCRVCGCSQVENGSQLDCHHIDYNKKNNNINNLIALCDRCHCKTNGNRNYWKNKLNFNREIIHGK